MSDSVTDSRISQLAHSFGNFDTMVDSNEELFNVSKVDLGTPIVFVRAGKIVRMKLC